MGVGEIRDRRRGTSAVDAVILDLLETAGGSGSRSSSAEWILVNLVPGQHVPHRVPPARFVRAAEQSGRGRDETGV